MINRYGHLTAPSIMFFLLLICLLPSPLFAADLFYDAAGFDPNRETFSAMPEEHIDPFTGGLTLTHVDGRLPGNGGLDLVIQRIYNSKNACNVWTMSPYGSGCSVLGNGSWIGNGWRMHFGTLYKHPGGTDHIIEMPDGSVHTAYRIPGSTTMFITKDFWLYDYYNNIVTLANGTKIYFDQQDLNLPNSTTNVFHATKIVDVHGNTITITYASTPNYTSKIDHITDSVGRVIRFYYSTLNSTDILTSISGPGVNISYSYQALSSSSHNSLVQANTLS